MGLGRVVTCLVATILFTIINLVLTDCNDEGASEWGLRMMSWFLAMLVTIIAFNVVVPT